MQLQLSGLPVLQLLSLPRVVEEAAGMSPFWEKGRWLGSVRWLLGWLNGQYYIDGLIINSVEGIRLIGQNGSLVNLLIHMDCKGDIMTKIMNIYYYYYHIFMKCHGSVLSNSVGNY